MLGAIVGDISGSRFEFHNQKSKTFDLMTHGCYPTDDTNMTLAVAQAILRCNGDWTRLAKETVRSMQEVGRVYPHGFGGSFRKWVWSDDPQPYNSWGNGSAMRVSPCAQAASTLEEALHMADAVTAVTHNHPEGMKGAQATTTAIFMAKIGSSMLEIRDEIHRSYYQLNFCLDDIRSAYTFDVSCQGSVPQAIEAFLESTSFEDAIRNAISIGGDSDTIAAITGSIAEAYYGIPADIRNHVLTFLDAPRLAILNAFEQKYGMTLAKDVGRHITRTVAFIPAAKTPKSSSVDTRQMSMLEAVDITTEALHAGEPETRETTANRLFNHLYEACNILRGPINQDEYKSYTIPILFLKRISDCYDEETAAANAKYGDDVSLYDEDELHSFIVPEHCHWQDIRETSEDVGKAISDALNCDLDDIMETKRD